MRAFLSAVLLCVLAACSIFPAKHSFRLTLEVESDGQIKTASSVYRLAAREFFSPSGWQTETFLEGDAIFMDLGDGRSLLALIAASNDSWGNTHKDLTRRIFLPKYRGSTMERYRDLGSMSGSAEVPERSMPLLATLPNINDPKSLHHFNGTDLYSVFGNRVRFRRMTIELTRDGVTRGIEKNLKWLPAMREEEKDKAIIGRPNKLTIHSGIFTRSE